MLGYSQEDRRAERASSQINADIEGIVEIPMATSEYQLDSLLRNPDDSNRKQHGKV